MSEVIKITEADHLRLLFDRLPLPDRLQLVQRMGLSIIDRLQCNKSASRATRKAIPGLLEAIRRGDADSVYLLAPSPGAGPKVLACREVLKLCIAILEHGQISGGLINAILNAWRDLELDHNRAVKAAKHKRKVRRTELELRVIEIFKIERKQHHSLLGALQSLEKNGRRVIQP